MTIVASIINLLIFPPTLKPNDPKLLSPWMSSSEMKTKIKVLNKSKNNETKHKINKIVHNFYSIGFYSYFKIFDINVKFRQNFYQEIRTHFKDTILNIHVY